MICQRHKCGSAQLQRHRLAAHVLCWHIIVYRMDRPCGGAHEISGIPAPLWLRGCVVLGSRGGMGGGVVGYGVVGVGWSLAVYGDSWWIGVVLSGLTWSGD